MIRYTPMTREHAIGWRSLWRMSVGDALDKKVIDHTERQILDPDVPLFALLALSPDDEVVGLLHGVVHPVAGSMNSVCYMQDLFVHPARRRQHIATDLIKFLAAKGTAEKWDRIYWLTDRTNREARALYSHNAVTIDFTFHVLPLGMLEKLGVQQ